ncbi:MAG TPA: hypothetical protein VD971_00810 [Phycisphaerales bacterium]|nr:hypothetical protein [Phycisphaerales bacterium]
MNTLFAIALIGWVPLGIMLFVVLPARRAVAACFVLGWLFLPPNAKYSLPGLPEYDKYAAISFAAVMGAVIFDSGRLIRFRPGWFDLPAVVFLVAPFFSSMSNGLGVNDGLSGVFRQTQTLVIPYFMARVYFADLSGVRELALWIFAGGLLYAPLCLIEMRISPQLNRMLYGYHQHAFGQTIRSGGYRPMVFMQHGLMVGLWMCSATVVGATLWITGSVRRFFMLPMGLPVAGLAVVSIACRSFGAAALMVAGLGVALVARTTRLTFPLLVLAAASLGYMALRGSGLWDGNEFVRLAESVAGGDRAGSLQVRVQNETVLVRKALQQPLFGWGGWNRNRVDMDDAGFRIFTDGLWVIILGQRGLVGLVSWAAMLTLPIALFVWRWRRGLAINPYIAPAFALAIITAMFVADCMFNAMLNPVFGLTAGALAGLIPTPDVVRAVTANAPARRAPPMRSAPPPITPPTIPSAR